MASTLPDAVRIRGGEKRYGTKSNSVLAFANLNLTLPRGNIYALLGPSGCGKTTLLRCILGRIYLDKGSVMVFGHSPGSKESGIPGPTVGYMAQETTVYLTMTISEYLRYFGTILGMEPKQIQSKTDYFIQLLRLPPKESLASKLSGGQLRRVQFAAALIHDPKLIILDEPTVGIDVITKIGMWEHITKLVRNQDTSVILTTHYIEEARLADKVGMIHGNTMAAEDTTANLLKKYQESSLEGVFLKICHTNDIEVVVNNNAGCGLDDGTTLPLSAAAKPEELIMDVASNRCDSFSEISQTESLSKRCGFNISWHRLYPTMMRSLLILYRFPGILLLLALVPSSQVIMYTLALGNPIGGSKIIIINEDQGQHGARYLSYLDPKKIVQIPYEQFDSGRQALIDGKSQGILRIGFNFSDVLLERYSDAALATSELTKAGTLQLLMDNTNINIAKSAEFYMLEVFWNFLHDTFSYAGINPRLNELPIKISPETLLQLTRPPSVTVIPGCLLTVSFFSAVPIAIFTIYMDRHRGYLEPNLIAGVTTAEIIFGVILVQLFTIVIQNVAILLAALPILNTFNNGSMVLLFCLLYVQGFCGTSLGIFLSFLFDQPELMFSIVVTTIFVAPALAAQFWPLESMPALFRYFSRCFPLTIPVRAVEAILHRGWDLRHSVVLGAFGVSFFWIFLLISLSFVICYRKK